MDELKETRDNWEILMLFARESLVKKYLTKKLTELGFEEIYVQLIIQFIFVCKEPEKKELVITKSNRTTKHCLFDTDRQIQITIPVFEPRKETIIDLSSFWDVAEKQARQIQSEAKRSNRGS
jgi:hypothetical protein